MEPVGQWQVGSETLSLGLAGPSSVLNTQA